MDNNNAMGDRNGPISPYDNDDCRMRFDIMGGEYLLVAKRMIVDQDTTSNTIGSIESVDVEVGHERICFVYLFSGDTQSDIWIISLHREHNMYNM